MPTWWAEGKWMTQALWQSVKLLPTFWQYIKRSALGAVIGGGGAGGKGPKLWKAKSQKRGHYWRMTGEKENGYLACMVRKAMSLESLTLKVRSEWPEGTGHVKITGQTTSAKPARLERAWHVGESQRLVLVKCSGRQMGRKAKEEGRGHGRQGL